MNICRMHRATRPAADYRGAMLAGGRWNPIGIPMLYTAEHLSVACLEVLLHLDKSQLPRDYVWSKAELPGSADLFRTAIPAEVTACQIAGERWVEREQLAIRAPSIIVPEEFNILVNPNHTGYAALAWSEARPFQFDRRLFASEPRVM